jgi:2-haloacid dehalogenase
MLAAGSVLAGGIQEEVFAQAPERPRFKAVAFDAFPIFDPRPISVLAESLFPGKGTALMDAWRTRQFEYQWLRALSGHYADFLQATQESLFFASKQLKLDLSEDNRRQLMTAWSNLQVWPDAPEALQAMHKAGLRLAFLSNMTVPMLADGVKRAELEGVFESILSTDQIRSYKPDPRAYQMAVDKLQLKREEILFVAFAGWDVAGAKWFGYPTFWVNRLDSPMEELGVQADASGKNLEALLKFVLQDGQV